MARLYFLAYFIFTSCLVAGGSPQYALRGTKNHLKPDISGRPTTILWKHNGNKVVEFDGSEQQEYKPFDNRITLDWHTAELEITYLRFEDSGDYDLEVEINHNLHTSQYRLEVMDKVVKPTVSCERDKDSSSDESKNAATLLCSAGPQKPKPLTKIEWTSKGMLHTGSKLPITLGDEHDEVEYTCSVSNPLSSETTSFTAKECYNDKTSSVPLIVGLSIFIPLLLLLGIAGLIFCKWRQKACFAQPDPEKPSATKGKGSGTTEEKESFLHRAETIPSHQPLVQATDQDQMPPKGMVKGRIDLFNKGINNDEQSLPQRRDFDIDKHEQEEPGSAPAHRGIDSPSLQDLGPHKEPAEKDVIQSEANDQDQARKSTGSTEEDQQPDIKVETALLSDHSDSEEKKFQEQADVSDQSSEGQKSDLETATEHSGLQNNKHEQQDPGFTPESQSSDSPSQKDPAHNLDIYTSDPDQDQSKDAAEKEVLQSKSTDTEEAKTQDQASVFQETIEKDPHSDHSDSEGENDPEQADVSDQSSEGKQSSLETAAEQSEMAQEEGGNSLSPGDQEAKQSGLGTAAEKSEKDVIQPETNDQGQARKSTGSTEENQQPGVKAEAAQQSDHSDSEEENVQKQTDVSDQSSEGQKSDLEASPEHSGTETKSKEPLSSSPTESSPGQDQDEHADINKDESSPDELKQTGDTKTSDQNTSDLEETQASPEPAASGLDEDMAQEEGGNSLSPGGASTLPSGDDTSPGDHERKINNEEKKDSDEGAKLPPQMDPNQDPESNIKDSNPDVNQNTTVEEKVLSSDQSDSGQNNEAGPADNSEPDVDAGPKPEGYVKKEVDRIDNECSKDEQTHLKKDIGGTESESIPPLSPATPAAGSTITGNLNSDLKDNDPDTNKPKDPAEENAMSDHINSVKNNEPGPADVDTAPKQGGEVKAGEPEGTVNESGSDQVNEGEPEESIQGPDPSEDQRNRGNSDPSHTEEFPHDSVPKTSDETSTDICTGNKTLNTPQDGRAKEGEQTSQDSTE